MKIINENEFRKLKKIEKVKFLKDIAKGEAKIRRNKDENRKLSKHKRK